MWALISLNLITGFPDVAFPNGNAFGSLIVHCSSVEIVRWLGSAVLVIGGGVMPRILPRTMQFPCSVIISNHIGNCFNLTTLSYSCYATLTSQRCAWCAHYVRVPW